ncbi:MAG: histidine ammonia-lyase [Methanobacteriota archaeon]|nr:MAG: histidine ammonia-lyase [Euryarchaeota archaeon]
MISIDGETLGISDLVRIARGGERVKLAPSSQKAVRNSRAALVKIMKKGKVAYGIKTGFGELANVRISDEDTIKLQRNLVRSHSVGVGDLLPEESVRAILALRANTLAKGCSGVREEVILTIIEMLNKGIHPAIPEKGSVGASGDLAPLAHVALAAMGEGKVHHKGEEKSSSSALKSAKIKPITYESKEALALVNGTAGMTGLGALCVHDAVQLLKDAQVAGSMSFEALKGSSKPFDARISEVRPHPGQKVISKNMLRLLENSEIIPSHKDCPKVQDAYTLRCMPQVFGSIHDTLGYTQRTIEIEMNSATDNPLILPEGKESLSGGNFHGQPVAMSLDFLGLALTVLGSFSERRIARLVDGHLSGLPPFLVEDPGLNSGMMMLQCTAAALASENKVLSHPSSSDSIPTSANQEDFVSMGMSAALKAKTILKNAQYIVSIEYLCAAQGLDFLKPLKPGRGAAVAYRTIRKGVPRLKEDRVLSDDVEKIFNMVHDGDIVEVVEKELSELG